MSDATPVDSLLVCARAVDVGVQPERIALARRAVGMDPVEVARLLCIPVRTVRLDDDWWRGDSGPYVVVRRDGSFAAAVPRARGYTLMADGSESTLAARNAAGLAAQAWSVLPALPTAPTGIGAVLRRSVGAGSRLEVAVAAMSAVLLTLFGIAVPLLAGVVVGELVPLDEASRIIVVGAVLVLVAVATFGLATVQSLLVQRLAMRADLRATAMILLRLVQLPMSFFRRYGAGDLQQRIQGLDDVTVQVSASVLTLSSMFLLAISGLVVMFIVSPPLAGLVLILLLLMSVVAVLAVRSVVRARSSFVGASLALSGLTLSLFTGIAKLRVAGAEPRMLSRWVRSYADRQRAANAAALGNQRIGMVAALAAPLVTFVVVIGSASDATPLALGGFTSFVAAAGQTSAALAGMLVPASVLFGLTPIVKALEPILQESLDQAADAEDPGRLSGEVELADVSFAYGPDEPEVLRDVRLHVASGEFVAIVGPSGSGKSTLVRLLIGLETPTAGQVRYDGRPLRDLDAEAVRRQIGVVVQSAQLATGTLLENIIGISPRTEDEAWTAARLAGIADDIAAMPMGMQTLVSDGASTFSGGQKQRILLARALVRQPRIVILDEATSTLDNTTQATVVESLQALGATRIVVAHRLSTVKDADRIVVLDTGRVVETGTYDQLVAAGGLFSRMAQRQVL